MAETTRTPNIGMKNARLICTMLPDQRLEFIAEGLPILLESAKSLARASQALKQFPREALILERLCEEECAKILILVDVIRCPNKIAAQRVGKMMRWFYNHLARLIYADAQTWKPVDASQLQEYIDSQRQSHSLEGEYDEYILPNWALYERESSLYADVVVSEDGEPMWQSPVSIWEASSHDGYLPPSFGLTEALEAFGIFTKEGLKVVAEVWGKHEIGGESDESRILDRRALCRELKEGLESAGLIEGHATQEHARHLLNHWQMPMYNMDFTKIQTSLEELREQQGTNIPYDW